MQRLKERLSIARQALKTLTEALQNPKTPIIRDASIQRFEYTFEAVWKAAQLYLKVQESLELGSPKSVIRGCLRTGHLTEEQARLAMDMADHRNLTAHTYDETLAEMIYANLNAYATLMDSWLGAMQRGLHPQSGR